MNYISDCCSAPAVEGSLDTWNDYRFTAGFTQSVVTYGTCSKCKKSSLFSKGE